MRLISREVRVFVDDVTTVRVFVGRPAALDDLLRRPARAVEVVVEERELERFGHSLPPLKQTMLSIVAGSDTTIITFQPNGRFWL